MILADYHTHSTLDDGKSTLAEMASAACARGLRYFGFSGHSWCPWEEDLLHFPGKDSGVSGDRPGAEGPV